MRLFEIKSSLKQEILTFPYMTSKFVYDSSPLKFEKVSGISVHQDYKMPENLSVEEIYHYYSSLYRALDSRKIKSDEFNSRMQRLTDAILVLNPELAAIRNDKIRNAQGHIIVGALSRFNIDDIKSYVSGKTGMWYYNRPEGQKRQQMQQEIIDLTNAPIGWIMSDKTLYRVYQQVLKKFKK